ncbi:MMPL family transporter [Mycobacterium sp. 663a-19]|uniref:MMPL family transporter n=1 Tax=Mycobacterium sp. 663a-19 TaxID=2986148 RepID=UPI002D1F3A73|nr:MMPL family transporter [Mycobacterium sp. 663a-19]MEB3980766.1 MMPL family transporter [Mycobacterium sp. 663a-19]
MLERLTRFVVAAPRLVLGAALLIAVAAAVFGLPVTSHLAAGGQQDPTSESARVARILVEKFGISEQSLVLMLSSDQGARSPATTKVAGELEGELRRSGVVLNLASAWNAPPPVAAGLFSKDGKSGMIVAGLIGGENDAQKHATRLIKTLGHDRDGVSVRAGGMATIYGQINKQTERDLMTMESIAIPVTFVALVAIFGGLNAALLPLVVGVFSIVGSMSILRALSYFTDVSIFSLNLTIAMGLGLAIDYSLLIINRYREEVAAGMAREDALVLTMRTSGRTVLFAALTVALSLVSLVLFPMYFLRSFAYAGVAVVGMGAVAALFIVPAVITLLGDRIDALNIRPFFRRILRRPEPVAAAITDTFWYRTAKHVMAQAVPVALAIVAMLLLLGSPFLHVKLGFPDDRTLPASASARQVGDQLRTNFNNDDATNLSIVVEHVKGPGSRQLDGYAAALSRVQGVAAVSAPTGAYVNGNKAGPALTPTGINDGTGLFTVRTTAQQYTAGAKRQLDALHAIPAPAGTDALFGGGAQLDRDAVNGILSRLPWVLSIIAVVTFALLFMLTGSVVLPLKALVLNLLSLTATFGALVWIFQQGHLGALGTDPTGTITSNMPILMFCIAFGLSMDYEVFLMSRIREYWMNSCRTRADNDESVALGVARTGRVITAAAVIMSISFGALIAAQVSFMRMFGAGLTIAILMDATVIRMLVVPAFMRILGRLNWWAPPALARWHARWGITDEPLEQNAYAS